MTPNFALSLSFDGIRLLHRAMDGWQLVGDVRLDEDDFDAAMAALHRDATALEPGGVRTKLLIPNEQIKYTAIDSTRTTEADVKAALDGATPYAIDDLAIDYDRTGGRTHIAACAHETLQEAEDFAVKHGFAPLTFAAIAPPFTFGTEVFFGPTKAAATLVADLSVLDRDAEPVKILGQIPDSIAEFAKTPKPDVASDTQEFAEPKADPEPELGTETPDPEPEVVFASRARDDAAPAATAADPASPKPKPVVATPTGAQTTEGTEPPLFARRRDPEGAGATQSAPLQANRQDDIGAAPITAPVPAPVAATPRAPAPTKAKSKSKADVAVFGSKNTAKVNGKPRYLGLMLTAALVIVMFLVALWANTLTEDGIAGWLRTDPGIVEAPEPEIAVLPAAPGDDAVPTDNGVPSEAEVLASQDTAAPLPATEGSAGPLPILRENIGRVLSPAEADRIYAATGVYQRAPRLPLIPRTETLDGLKAAQSLPTPGAPPRITIPAVETMLPDFALAPQRDPPPPGTTYQRDLLGFILATPEGTITPDGVLVIAGRPEFAPPLRPGTEVVAPAVAPTRSANAIPGLRLVAGKPPVQPPLRPDDLVDEAALANQEQVIADAPSQTAQSPVTFAPTDSDVLAQISASVAAALAEQGDAAANDPSQQAETIAAVVTEPSDVASLTEVAASQADPSPADPTTTPDASIALNILPGRPSLEPPLRPISFSTLSVRGPAETDAAEDPEQPAASGAVIVNRTDLQTQSGASLISFRPAARAGSIERPTDLLALADPALAGVRPALRPDGLAPPDVDTAAIAAAVQSATEAELGNVIASLEQAAQAQLPASRLAVVRSPRPDARPNNFATVVARAQRTPTAQQGTTVSSAPATPTGPVPGGVARAATIEDAIRLRDINLIGVYGRPGDRRALVRLSNGSYIKVEIGSSLDGGRVTAIGDSALNYVKRGQTYALQLPAG